MDYYSAIRTCASTILYFWGYMKYMFTAAGILFSLISMLACKTDKVPPVKNVAVIQVRDTVQQQVILHDTAKWKELTTREGYVIDIKYATTDNFIGEAVYPCGKCFLVPAAARALHDVKADLEKEGYGLKLFDCYRPHRAQYKLWEKVPNPNYVAPPSEGSMHNRGVAVDLTLTDKDGNELDMGTPYDFFGPEAHFDYTRHSKEILDRRKLLRSMMERNGFNSIRTEWWHFSLGSGSYPLEDWQWKCN